MPVPSTSRERIISHVLGLDKDPLDDEIRGSIRMQSFFDFADRTGVDMKDDAARQKAIADFNELYGGVNK